MEKNTLRFLDYEDFMEWWQKEPVGIPDYLNGCEIILNGEKTSYPSAIVCLESHEEGDD